MSVPDENKALVRRFYEEIWNHGDLSVVPAILSSELEFRGSLGPAMTGHAPFEAYVHRVTAALGDYHCRVETMVAEGVQVVARMTFSGAHEGPFLGYPPTGRQLSWAGAAFFTVEQGLISAVWVLGDLQSLEQQLLADDVRGRRATDAF